MTAPAAAATTTTTRATSRGSATGGIATNGRRRAGPPGTSVEEASSARHASCADDAHDYFEATEDCRGYVWCNMGAPGLPTPCDEELLYDQKDQQCNWANQVSCGSDAEEEEEEIVAMTAPVPPNVYVPCAGGADGRHDATKGCAGYACRWTHRCRRSFLR